MAESWTAANTVPFVLVFAFVGIGVGALLIPARLLRRCPECRNRTLERTGNQRSNNTWLHGYQFSGRMVTFREREYRCKTCGTTSWH